MKNFILCFAVVLGISLTACKKDKCYECNGSNTYTELEVCEGATSLGFDLDYWRNECESTGGTWSEK